MSIRDFLQRWNFIADSHFPMLPRSNRAATTSAEENAIHIPKIVDFKSIVNQIALWK
jgi:hypothetical protein